MYKLYIIKYKTNKIQVNSIKSTRILMEYSAETTGWMLTMDRVDMDSILYIKPILSTILRHAYINRL